jgi:hypothetical protein
LFGAGAFELAALFAVEAVAGAAGRRTGAPAVSSTLRSFFAVTVGIE